MKEQLRNLSNLFIWAEIRNALMRDGEETSNLSVDVE